MYSHTNSGLALYAASEIWAELRVGKVFHPINTNEYHYACPPARLADKRLHSLY